MWKPSWAVAAAAVVVALVAVPALPAAATGATGLGVAASGAPRIDYPSWDEVNAAKQNEQAAANEVARINASLDALEALSAQRADEALQRGQEYLQAKAAAEAAASYAATLQTQADDATAKAERATTQVGLLAAQLYRSGGDSSVNLVLNQNDSESLLYQLGTMSKLTEQTGRIRDAAEAAKNTADVLEKQAQVAKSENDTLQTTADQRLQAAQAAQDAADAELADAEVNQERLVAQLASLKNTTAAVESAYREGQAQLAAQRAAQAAAEAAARSSADVTDSPGSAWVPGSGEVASPAEAQAYAQSIMGGYGWGGDQFSCLVRLWIGESGWRANAYNPSSGAYGIPQSLPASKMASVGSDFVTNHQTQIIWGMNYIASRYDTPCNALSQWTARNPHWY